MTKLARLLGTVALVAACSLIAACSKKADPPAASPPPPIAADPVPTVAPASEGWYRAVIGEKQGTAIPFFLQLPSSGDAALIATGPDRIRAKMISGPPKVALEFDILLTRIDATVQPDKTLEGTWQSASGSWGASSLSFRAEPVAGPDPALRFPAAAGGPDPAGVWKLALPDQTGKLVVTRGEGTELTATLAFQTGNLAFLAGNQEGGTLRLSAFDGASPYLLVAELAADGKTLTGTWTAGQALAWKEDLSGERTADFPLELQTRLAGARPKLKIPQLAKAPFVGNPVIVELGGSWCPACGHAVAKLRELQERHAGDGLQMLMLTYEFTDDPAYNQAQADSFKAKYEIPWDVVPVHGGLDRYAEIMPAGLEGIDASGFPITIFIGRDGTIEGFHSSFPRDQWGDVYERAVAEYDRLAARIVGSPKASPKAPAK